MEPIKIAIIAFPFIAFFITLPYILIQYHKYGSVYFYRTIIIYSFVLYLLTAYFLVILPLPSIESVKLLTSPRWQLQPFAFIVDILKETSFRVTDLSTYLPTLKTEPFLQAFFNILLCLPFGVYLHYYFRYNLKKTVLGTFCLSLFFEITQLTGLYFIYPRGYRLFDIDDLMLNTLGGCIGYFIGSLFLKILPNREEIDKKAKELGTRVSFLRRITAFLLDICLFHILYVLISGILSLFLPLNIFRQQIYFIGLILYYIILPIINHEQTLAQQFLNLKLSNINQSKNTKWYQILLYQVSFYLFYIKLYPLINTILIKLNSMGLLDNTPYQIFIILLTVIYFVYLLISIVRKAASKPLIYERISQISLSSTIKIDENISEE